MNKVTTTSAPAAIGPYSQAWEHAGLVFASGQLPVPRASPPRQPRAPRT